MILRFAGSELLGLLLVADASLRRGGAKPMAPDRPVAAETVNREDPARNRITAADEEPAHV